MNRAHQHWCRLHHRWPALNTHWLFHQRRSRHDTAPSNATTLQRVNALVGQGDAAAAVAAVQGSLLCGSGSSTFSWPALSATLHACLANHQASLGLSLVNEVRAVMKADDHWKEESVLAVLLQLHCETNDAVAAKHLFSYLLQHRLLRRRTASVYLRFCCTHEKDRDLAFAVFSESLRLKLELPAADLLALGKLCLQVGEPCTTLDALLEHMQDYIPEVSEAMAKEVLLPWWLSRAEEVSISPDTASVQCPACRSTLGGYPFTVSDRQRLLHDLTEVVVPATCRSSRARRGFDTWKRFLTEAMKGGYAPDLLIDGANLGYYGLSSWYHISKEQLLQKQGTPAPLSEETNFSRNCKKHPGGKSRVDVGVNLRLIDAGLQLAKENGFVRPLVMLHERHCEDRNLATAEDAAMVAQWRKQRQVYCTPSGLNDDLLWLFAALHLSRPREAACYEDNSARGPVAGTATQQETRQSIYVLTNDLMRDHHFQMLSQRCFVRWRSQHQIRFCCSREEETTHLHWKWPEPFTRCIQRWRSTDGMTTGWHVPVADTNSSPLLEEGGDISSPPSTRWMCLRA